MPPFRASSGIRTVLKQHGNHGSVVEQYSSQEWRIAVNILTFEIDTCHGQQEIHNKHRSTTTHGIV
jgi:hypothetical protein